MTVGVPAFASADMAGFTGWLGLLGCATRTCRM